MRHMLAIVYALIAIALPDSAHAGGMMILEELLDGTTGLVARVKALTAAIDSFADDEKKQQAIRLLSKFSDELYQYEKDAVYFAERVRQNDSAQDLSRPIQDMKETWRKISARYDAIRPLLAAQGKEATSLGSLIEQSLMNRGIALSALDEAIPNNLPQHERVRFLDRFEKGIEGLRAANRELMKLVAQ